MPGITHVHNRAEYVKATNEPGLVVLEATATWCSQCKAIQPVIDKLLVKYPDVQFFKYDVEEGEDVAQELGARVMPTFSFFKDGEIADGLTGAKPDALEKLIQQHYSGRVVEDAE